MNQWIASLLVLCLVLSMNLAPTDIVTCAQEQAELSDEYGAE